MIRLAFVVFLPDFFRPVKLNRLFVENISCLSSPNVSRTSAIVTLIRPLRTGGRRISLIRSILVA